MLPIITAVTSYHGRDCDATKHANLAPRSEHPPVMYHVSNSIIWLELFGETCRSAAETVLLKKVLQDQRSEPFEASREPESTSRAFVFTSV